MQPAESDSSHSVEYRVAKVEKVSAPCGADGDNWHTYVIERNNGTNIVGNRRGTLEQVKRYAREFVEDINLRSGKGGYSTWTTRKNRQARAGSNK